MFLIQYNKCVSGKGYRKCTINYTLIGTTGLGQVTQNLHNFEHTAPVRRTFGTAGENLDTQGRLGAAPEGL